MIQVMDNTLMIPNYQIVRRHVRQPISVHPDPPWSPLSTFTPWVKLPARTHSSEALSRNITMGEGVIDIERLQIENKIRKRLYLGILIIREVLRP